MPTTSMKKGRDDDKVEMLLQKKFELSAQMQSIKAQIADLNHQMVKVGASTEEIACL